MENNNQNAIVKKESSAIIKYPEAEKVPVIPLADLFETADDFILKLDIPGVRKEDIRLTIEHNRLMVHAAVKNRPDQNSEMIYSEIESKVYIRDFNLSDGIDLDVISALYDNGVLTIILPKTDESKARNIKIN